MCINFFPKIFLINIDTFGDDINENILSMEYDKECSEENSCDA